MTIRIVGYNIKYVINLNQQIMKKNLIISKTIPDSISSAEISRVTCAIYAEGLKYTLTQKPDYTNKSINCTWEIEDLTNEQAEDINELFKI